MSAKQKRILLGVGFLLLLGLGGVIYSVDTENVGEEQPLFSVDKQKIEQGIERLDTGNESIVKIDQSAEYEWYLTKMEQGQGFENIKNMFSSKGWTFVEQEGAGYFFEKDGQLLIVTTEMWTRKYVLAKVPVQGDCQ